MHTNKEYDILEIVHNHPASIRQRELATAADLSLGMTNAILKKLVTKGLLVMRRINSRNIQYALTGEGMLEVARRSTRLLKRTLKSVVEYREAIEQLVSKIKGEGYDSICLQGPSDIDFIVEWACLKQKLNYGYNGRAIWETTGEKIIQALREMKQNANATQS